MTATIPAGSPVRRQLPCPPTLPAADGVGNAEVEALAIVNTGACKASERRPTNLIVPQQLEE